MVLKPPKPFCSPATCRVRCCVTQTNNTENILIKSLLGRQGNEERFFVDGLFPADPKSLFKDPDRPWGGHIPLEHCQWLRPKDFCPGKPQVWVNGVEPGDVIQGMLGDCWLLGALSVLATDPNLLHRLFLSEENAACGIYTVAVYKEEYWHQIVIDDRILCTLNKKPLYGRCKDDNELWVMLLEKAYAKVHKCYENLISGFVDYGLKDLCGGVPEVIKVPQTAPVDGKTHEQLWQKLLTYRRSGCLSGCAFTYKGTPEVEHSGGILRGHAYGVLDIEQIDEHRLLRVRNPWGKREWKGRWSDGSPEWTKDILERLRYEFADDGTFWMSFDDFLQNFNTLYTCRIFPDSWIGQRVEGAWDSETAGGCPGGTNVTWVKNRQYLLKCSKLTNAVVVLSQEDKRMHGDSATFIPIGFLLIRVKDDLERVNRVHSGNIALSSGPFKPSRDISCECVLEPGCYRLIPMTYQPQQLSRFVVVIWSEFDVELEGEQQISLEERVPVGFSGEFQADLQPLEDFEPEPDIGVRRAEDVLSDLVAELSRTVGDLTRTQGDLLARVARLESALLAQSEQRQPQPQPLVQGAPATSLAASTQQRPHSTPAAILPLPRTPLAQPVPPRTAPTALSDSRLPSPAPAQSELCAVYLHACSSLGIRPNTDLTTQFPTVNKGVLDFNSRPIYMGNKGFLAVLHVLKAHVSSLAFTSLVLRGQGLTNDSAAALGEALRGYDGLTSLDLSRNKISIMGSQHIVTLLRTNPNITHLDVSNNELDDRSSQRIRIALEQNQALARKK